MDLKLDIQETNAILVFQLNWLQLQKRKMSFCLRTNKSFLSLLGDKQNLSLGEFGELKSHLFSVHFSDLFLSKKTNLCAEIWNNSPNCYAAGNSRGR